MPVKHPAQKLLPLVTGCVLLASATGCITITPTSPSLSWKSLTKPKVERASFEEKVPDAPGDPKNPARLKVAYGRVMEETGQAGEARKCYEDALALQPKEMEAILGLARLDAAASNLDQAELGLKKAVKMAPNSSLAQYSLGQFYAGQERWEEASEALTKAMLSEPDDTQARYALAVALVHTGKIDAALPHFIRTVGDAEAHYNVGLILQQQGHPQDAERHFAMAVTKKPELVAAQNWLAYLRRQHESDSSIGTENHPVAVLPAGHSAAAGITEAPVPNGDRPLTPQPVIQAPLPESGRQVNAQQIEQNRNQRSTAGL